MARNDIVHVAVAPPDKLDESLVKRAAAILDKDLYGTRRVLTAKIPRVIARYEDMHMAEIAAQNLRALGLIAIVCNDSELRKPSQVFRTQTLKSEEGAVLFWDKGGQLRRIESGTVFLIIKGSMQTYTEKEVLTTRMKFSLPATVLTGGIPIWRKVKEKTRDKSIQNEGFVRLYNRNSIEPTVEMLEYDLDYSFLGARMVASSLPNFETVTATIRDKFPQALLDDRLMEPFGVDIPFTAPQDAVEINCRLICLYHQAVSNLDSSV